MAGRGIKIIGLAGAAGAGYYLYQAGGSPKVAEKQFEHDAAKLSSKVRNELPGREKELKTQGKLYGEEAGKKFDSAIEQAKAQANQAEAKFEQYKADATAKFESARKETAKDVNNAIDKFDKEVSKGAAQTKGWFSGWFGGSK